MPAFGDRPEATTHGGAVAIIAPILAFVVLPLGVWAWLGLGLGQLVSEFFHGDVGNWLAGAVFVVAGVWLAWLVLSRDVWPALRRFGEWLGRE
jgi:hypothetical protein